MLKIYICHVRLHSITLKKRVAGSYSSILMIVINLYTLNCMCLLIMSSKRK